MAPFLAPDTTRKIWFWLGITVVFFLFLFLIRSILLPFVVGIGTAYFLDPAADRLERLGVKRGTATALITVGFFSIILLVLLLLTPLLVKQLGGFIEHLPGYIRALREHADIYLQKLPFSLNGADGSNPLNEGMLKGARNVAMGVLQSGLVVVNLLSLLVITPVVAFYLLRDWDQLTERVDNLLPRRHAEVIRKLLREMDAILAGFIRGQFNVMMILGTLYAVGLSVVGLPFGVLIGLMAGMLIIIPYIGAFIGTAAAVGIALVQFDEPWRIGAVCGVFVLGQILESYFLTPNLVGNRVGLHPAWVIFGMLAGGTLFGFVGVLLAVPVTAVIGVLVRFGIERYLESSLYVGS